MLIAIYLTILLVIMWYQHRTITKLEEKCLRALADTDEDLKKVYGGK